MTNDLTKKPSNLPAPHEEEADTLLDATQGHEKLLKFVKGKYKAHEDEVLLGTQYVAHANQLTYCWIKFVDKKVVERRHGRAVDKWVPPERQELGDTDQSKWEIGLDGKAKDPWSFQRLIPFEHMESGEVVIFTTSSIGGEIATNELCRAYAHRLKRNGSRALPIVRLASKDMPTNAFGNVPRPHFEVDGWEDVPASGDDTPPAAHGDDTLPAADEMNDAIPF
jgi:hypothetical protein